MVDQRPIENSLVLYKGHAARVLGMCAKDRLEIELEAGTTQRVRPKDITLLHPGPLQRLSDLHPETGDIEEAWQLLAGQRTDLTELAELIFGVYTPSTAWAAWQLVQTSPHFAGSPQQLSALTAEELTAKLAAHEAKETRQREWRAFLERVRAGSVLPQDAPLLSEVTALAYARQRHSRLLRELKRQETAENAHTLLLKLGHWDLTANPHPLRLGLILEPPALEVPALPDNERMDLTHLCAFAIDDEGNEEPDDAISLQGDRLWVHVADVAALTEPDTPLDLEARGRGASLYLPERAVPMLPVTVTRMLGLGLNTLSPALSFGIRLGRRGEIADATIALSWVRVTRMTYAEAEERLHATPFKQLCQLTDTFRARRRSQGAAFLTLPEVKIQAIAGEVRIRPLPPLKSRDLVTEAMLMAGEAAARFALEHDLPFPFTAQAAPDDAVAPDDLAGMFAYRKRLRRSQMTSVAQPHAGLGLELYTQATSPLRRYLDLVAHQQLRAFLCGSKVLTAEEVLARVAATDAVIGTIRRAERLSNLHWTLVYLAKHPQWTGEGIVVEKRDRRVTVLIPELGLDAEVHVSRPIELNASIHLGLSDVDLPMLAAHFRPRS